MSVDLATLKAKVKAIESQGTPKTAETSSKPLNPEVAPEPSGLFATGDDIAKRIRWNAMDLLSRREHSQKELRLKLSKRYPDNLVEIEHCIADLAMEGLQSEQRYCEAYVAMRHRKGYGPLRILSELRDKGVDDNMAKTEIYNCRFDWFASVADVWQKKFRGCLPQDAKERSRQMRFLAYRGFSQDQISTIYS
ncbi:MAG: recombination regulator RecX [Candidatus Pelagadaptatus aseana]|uniref:regulatory protein RecX n=1 Tax=Candidatus Pelagadaptatus aseana TaxID=3120508 RepID=UPI0039B315D5